MGESRVTASGLFLLTHVYLHPTIRYRLDYWGLSSVRLKGHMAGMHTHYDNLKVARNAPPEVIRAAYKTLSQKYHPDRHNGDKNASKVMAILNTSYEVLSDPVKRRAHDLWIAQQESGAAQRTSASSPEPAPRPQPPPPPSQPRSRVRPLLLHVARYWLLYGLGGLMAWGALSDPSPPPAGPKPYNQTPTVQTDPEPPKYVKPTSAPNGELWPTGADYVSGYEQLNAGGLSSVTIDNSQNDSDVFVKLVSLAGAEAYPTRQIYIPAFGKFTAERAAAGSYDIRYRDLDTGGLSRSDAFTLEETPTDGGTQYSTITMTLYKVQNGNMQTFPLAESEF